MEQSFPNDMSGPEEQVSDYLTKLGLHWIYQSPVFLYDEKKRHRVWTPDFYLPELGIYIEVCGSERFNYTYRKRMYNKNGFLVVFIHFYKEKGKWKTYLVRRIKEIEEQRHSEATKIIDSLSL
jgi:hypothetical protein